MRRLLAAVMLVLAVPATGAAAAGSEVLFVYPPDGWRLSFKTQVGKIRFYEYLPPGDTSAEWTEMISVQIMENAADLNPTELARTLRTRFLAECGRVQHRGPDRFNLGGYLAAPLYLECDNPIAAKRPGGAPYRRHEVAAFQIVQGRDDIYVIERAWHGPSREHTGAPSGRADLLGWDGFWHGIEVCDAAETGRPCFGLGLLSEEKADIFVAQADPQLPYGCDYFRVLTVLPDLAEAAKPTMVVPLKLGPGPFGDSKGEQAFISELLGAARQNRPAAVILTLSARAQAGIYTTDAAKAARDAAAIRAALVAGGVDAARLVETFNPRCPGS